MDDGSRSALGGSSMEDDDREEQPRLVVRMAPFRAVAADVDDTVAFEVDVGARLPDSLRVQLELHGKWKRTGARTCSERRSRFLLDLRHADHELRGRGRVIDGTDARRDRIRALAERNQ